MSGESKTRDRVPTFQDFMDEDFIIKEIDYNISRAESKIKIVKTEIKKLKKTKKKYKRPILGPKKSNAKKYFLELYTGMTLENFEATYKNEGGNTPSGMFSLLDSKMDDKIRKKEREIGTHTNYIDELKRKKADIMQNGERTASQAAQKAAQDAIVPEAIKAVEKFDNLLLKFKTYAGRKLTLKEKYNNQVDATHTIFELKRGNNNPRRHLLPVFYEMRDMLPMPKSKIYSIIDDIYNDVKRGEFNYEPRNSSQCWKNLKNKLKEKSPMFTSDEYPDIILPLIYKTLIFCIPFTRRAISLKSQAEIRINQLPDVIESEAPEDIKNLKLSFDYLKAELQNLNSNIEMFNSVRFLECMMTIAEIQSTMPRIPTLKKILLSIYENFPVETEIESKWLEITNLYEKIKKMEKIRREMREFYNRESPDKIMAKDAARDIDSWRRGSGTEPLSPEEIRELQRQMYIEAGKDIPYWLKRGFKPDKKRIAKSRARRRARAAFRNAGAAATRKLNQWRRKKTEGGRRKKTRKKRRKAKRTRKKRRK